LEDGILQKKVVSIHPSIEEWDDRLWGVTEVQIHETRDEVEYHRLVEFLQLQLSNGWGEVLEQRPITTPEGEFYLSFWTFGSRFFIKPEEEMLREMSEISEIGMK
jgi:hypothetical protein